jgi:carboxyl-terminal processing protease
MRPRRVSALPVVLVLGLLALAVGIYLGGHPSTLPGPVRDVLVQDTEGQIYDEAMDKLERDYYRSVDRKDLLNQSLDHAIRSLDDRFSNYFAPRDYSDFQQATEGRFEGVGMSVDPVDDGLRIITVYDGSPAKARGLKAGDVITAVNGKSIAGQDSDEATTRIKGPAGTSVRLTVRSADSTREVTLKRAEVEIPVVRSQMRRADGHKIAYVHLAGFTAGAHDAVGTAVRKLLKQGAGSVVLDLRDNGGGLLNEAVQVSSIFIPDGRIVSTKGRARPERVYDATGGAIDSDIPVVVLVNDRSASASEIVTGALQDRDRATVVGTRTFGKGVFQEIEPLSNGGALDITVGEYFLPSGRNLGGGGVSRGSGVKPDLYAKDDPKTPKDEALATALREAE